MFKAVLFTEAKEISSVMGAGAKQVTLEGGKERQSQGGE